MAATNGMVASILARLLGRSGPRPPLLVRVRGPRGAPDVVEIDAVWEPSGRRESRSCVTATGLCIVPWRRDERAVVIALRAAGASALVRLESGDVEDGFAHDVLLDDDIAAE